MRVNGFSLICLCVAGLLLGASRLHAEEEGAENAARIGVLFTFKGMVTEQSSDEDDDPLQFLSGQTGILGVREWIRKLDEAAASKKVGAVLLQMEVPQLSWEHAQVLREAVLKVRNAGKTVIACGECFTQNDFLVASAANKIYASPDGLVLIGGLSLRQWYLKGTLDKLGLQADMQHVGPYKGAGEPLTQSGPSKEAEEMMNWLLDDWHAQACEQIGKARGKDAAAGKAWVEGGPYTANQALAAGLIDGVKSRLDTINEVKQIAGLKESDRLEAKFGEKKGPAVDFGNPFAILKIWASMINPKPKAAAEKPAVGVIYAEGMIMSGQSGDEGMGGAMIGSASMVAAIEKARKDASVKTVVLRIDSPGGSAIASEEIHSALLKLKAAKPLVVSMGHVAASGGYYIAAPAERIFAHPTSIVGSIGVVGGKLVTKGLNDWIGMTSHNYKRGGDKAGLFDTQTPFTPAEKAWLAAMMNETYEMFVKAVKNGRGERLKDFEAKITGGKVFTGKQSLANGLVDELGGLDQAIAWAAAKSGLQAGQYETRVINKRPGFTQRFLKNLSGDNQDDVGASAAPAGGQLAQCEKVREWLAVLRYSSPLEAGVLLRQLRMLDMLRGGRVLMLMPLEFRLGQ